MNKLIPDIRFYDFSGKDFELTGHSFKLLHVENHFISSNWSVCYNDIGNFEAHFDLGSDTLPIIMDNDYIIAVQGKQAAVVVGKKTGDDLAVFGRTCNWLLTKRVTDKFTESGSKTLFDLVKEKVQTAFPEPSVTIGRTISTPPITAERSDKCETFKVVQELLSQKHLGHELLFDFSNSRFVFQVLEGNKSNNLVISATNRNAYDITMNGDSLDFCTEGWYKQKMEDGSLSWVIIQKQQPKTGIIRWETLLSGGSLSEAMTALNQAKRTNQIQGKTIGVSFGNDYSLGDVVLMEWQSGQCKKRVKKRIVGVNLWYESGNIGEEPVFEDFEDIEE